MISFLGMLAVKEKWYMALAAVPIVALGLAVIVAWLGLHVWAWLYGHGWLRTDPE